MRPVVEMAGEPGVDWVGFVGAGTVVSPSSVGTVAVGCLTQ